MAAGSLDDFFSQPSVSGGPAWSFKNKPDGTTYVGVVARPVTDADIQQQTQPGSNIPATYRNGQPKFVMRVAMKVEATPEFPEGEASWFVAGQSRDELVRAMAEAGVPAGPPEAGATISVTLVGRRPSKTPGFNPSNQVRIRYQRPAQMSGATAPPVDTVAKDQAASAATPNAATLTPPGDLTPEQQALLARLTGQTP